MEEEEEEDDNMNDNEGVGTPIVVDNGSYFMKARKME